MFYVATARYAEGNEGSTILGIYSTEKEAKEILKLYKKNAKFEFLAIEYIYKNIKPEDFSKIKPFRTADGDVFFKADGHEYENQNEYFTDRDLGSRNIFYEEVNR